MVKGRLHRQKYAASARMAPQKRRKDRTPLYRGLRARARRYPPRLIPLPLAAESGPAAVQFLAALDQTQWLSADRLQLYQRRLLDRLLRHARAETEFYADRLAPLFRGDDSIDWDGWQEIPILRRELAQERL